MNKARRQRAFSAVMQRKYEHTKRNKGSPPMNSYCLSISARAALLAAGAPLALPVLARAPIGPPAAAAVADQPAESVPAAPETVEDAYDDYSEDEIIVTAPRLAGQLDTDIKAEAELDEAAIAAAVGRSSSSTGAASAALARCATCRLKRSPRLRFFPKKSRCNMAIRPTSASSTWCSSPISARSPWRGRAASRRRAAGCRAK